MEPASAQAEPMFIVMILLTFASAMLSGSTLEWVFSRGVFSKGWKNPRNLYNIIVLFAASFAAIQTICSFMLYYFEPTQIWFLTCVMIQWAIMTHTSVMVVSNRLSMLYRNSQQVWRRLLLINVAMVPVTLLVFVSWGGDKLSGASIYANLNKIIEPIQITLWGSIEFILSGMFIVKMWHFKWTSVERKAILVLVLVGLCDLSTVFANILVGDLESTVVKAFAYCLRIRLEVNVLCVLVKFMNEKRDSMVSGLEAPSTSRFSNPSQSINLVAANSFDFPTEDECQPRKSLELLDPTVETKDSEQDEMECSV